MRKNILKVESLIILLLVAEVGLELIFNYLGEIIFLRNIRITVLIMLIIFLFINLKKSIKKLKEKNMNNSKNNILTLVLAIDIAFRLIYKYIFNLIFLKYIQLVLLSIGLIFCLKRKD